MGVLKGLPDVDFFLEVADSFLKDVQRKGLLDLMKMANENLRNAIELERREKLNKEVELLETLVKSISESSPEAKAEIMKDLLSIVEKTKKVNR